MAVWKVIVCVLFLPACCVELAPAGGLHEAASLCRLALPLLLNDLLAKGSALDAKTEASQLQVSNSSLARLFIYGAC